MPLSISQKEMGKRIMELRKVKGLSQEELAKSIGISRSSLVQIEQGNRYVDVLELHKLSLVLGFSLDDFLSADFKVEDEVKQEGAVKEKKENVRISVPALQINKFKNVLLYILERCAGKPNVGETVLYKLLYFCDFNYYELYEEYLTGARYRKLPYGPVPQKLDTILNQMIEKGQLKRIKTEYFDKPQIRYIPLTKADLTQLSAAEKDVIDKVIEQMGDWNASTISSYSHNDKPWKATEEGDYISYNLAFYRRPQYQMIFY
jgi:transcriptional regulator with XRE-family HTH domain